VARDARVELFSDSSYVNGVLCKGWKAKANKELIVGLRERLKARPNVTIHWIAGHVGVDGNEKADVLANAGVAGKTARKWR
jgi:ribonuclease HI